MVSYLFLRTFGKQLHLVIKYKKEQGKQHLNEIANKILVQIILIHISLEVWFVKKRLHDNLSTYFFHIRLY